MSWSITILLKYGELQISTKPSPPPNNTIFVIFQVIMATKSIVNLGSPLFLGVDTTEEGEGIVTCDKCMKDEGEVILSHFAIYLGMIFGSVVWDTFTNNYRLSLANFPYYPLKKCAIERMAEANTSVSSLIATNNSVADINQFFSNCGLSYDFKEVSHEIEFDLTHQVSLHIGADICGILGDINGDSGTIKTDCSASILPQQNPIFQHQPIISNQSKY